MTTEELIKRLKTLPPETPVLVEGYETGYDDIAGLKPLKVTRYRNAQDWDGEYQASEKFSDTENSAFSAVLIFGRRGYLRKVQVANVTIVKAMEELDAGQGQRFSLDELIAQCDPDAPMPEELQAWENAEPAGLEYASMSNAGLDQLRSQAYAEILDLFNGNKSAADHWVCSQVRGLNYRAPSELLNSPKGIDTVRTLIGRLKHGIPT
ncbi:antitoxin Xre/MbcA/ParS toxin-binding domain-containing protein [Marinobacter sp. V034]|uniref:antitoxin Xre/MbcA/ParS toxin-binding domain-containing protein n=1 Tax=Marinobacter sp. V034 TaxID=3459610 RepID=UPI00404407DE